MIGTLWEQSAPEINPYIYVVVMKSSSRTWQLLEITSGITVNAWEELNGEMKLISVGGWKTPIFPCDP